MERAHTPSRPKSPCPQQNNPIKILRTLNSRDVIEAFSLSITFLALYRSVGIPPERRLFYGVVNHAIRGVVTASDNLLDDEYKLLLPLTLTGNGSRSGNIANLLL